MALRPSYMCMPAETDAYALQCRTPSRGIPLISEASEMAINCFSDKYMKSLYTIFSVWKEKRGETVLRAVASALVLPELIS